MENFGRCPRRFLSVPWGMRRKSARKPVFTGFPRILEGFPICPRCPLICPREGFGDKSGDSGKSHKYGLPKGFLGSLSPLSPISRKTILFFIFRFPISFFKIGDNGDKRKKKPHISFISGLFSISMFQIFRGHGDKLGDNGDKWQILELSDNVYCFLIF